MPNTSPDQLKKDKDEDKDKDNNDNKERDKISDRVIFGMTNDAYLFHAFDTAYGYHFG